MDTIVVVNGSFDWKPWFPGYQVQQVYLQNSRWLFQDKQLWIIDKTGAYQPKGIMWRLGAVEPQAMHRACLEMIRLSKVPCLNPAQTLLRGYDRLCMLTELSLAGLPVIDFEIATGNQALQTHQPRFPAVLKLDNYHAGQAKALAQTQQQWQDLVSLASVYMGYATTEPFIDYKRDIRCLVVGDRIWAMERSSQTWKANVDTDQYQLIEPEPQLVQWTMQAKEHFQADTLGLDFLQQQDGQYILLESNDIPGILGFPDEVPRHLSRILIERMQRQSLTAV